MNPDFPKTPREELEAKLTALLLGELSAEEAALLRVVIEQDAELRRLHDQLKNTIALVNESLDAPVEQTAPLPPPLKLSSERREKLLAHFKTVAPREFAQPKRRVVSWLIPVAAAAALIILLIPFAIPNFVHSRQSSEANAVINNLRQLDAAKREWAMEAGQSGNTTPTMDDLKPYMGRGTENGFPPIAGEHYVVGKVGESPKAIDSSGRVISLVGPEEIPAAQDVTALAAARPTTHEKLGLDLLSVSTPPPAAPQGAQPNPASGEKGSEKPADSRQGVLSQNIVGFANVVLPPPSAPAAPPAISPENASRTVIVLPSASPAPVADSSSYAREVEKLNPVAFWPLQDNSKPAAESLVKNSGEISMDNSRSPSGSPQQPAITPGSIAFGASSFQSRSLDDGGPIVAPPSEKLAEAEKATGTEIPQGHGTVVAGVTSSPASEGVATSDTLLTGGLRNRVEVAGGGAGGGGGGGGFGGGGMGGGGGGRGGRGGRAGGGGRGGSVPARMPTQPATAPAADSLNSQFAEAGQKDTKALGFDFYAGSTRNSGAIDGTTTTPPTSDQNLTGGLRDLAREGRSQMSGEPGQSGVSSADGFFDRGASVSAWRNSGGTLNVDQDKVPLLGDVPIFGRLFRSEGKAADINGRSELANRGAIAPSQTDAENLHFFSPDSRGRPAVAANVPAMQQSSDFSFKQANVELADKGYLGATSNASTDRYVEVAKSRAPEVTTVPVQFSDPQQLADRLQYMFQGNNGRNTTANQNTTQNQNSALLMRQQQSPNVSQVGNAGNAVVTYDPNAHDIVISADAETTKEIKDTIQALDNKDGYGDVASRNAFSVHPQNDQNYIVRQNALTGKQTEVAQNDQSAGWRIESQHQKNGNVGPSVVSVVEATSNAFSKLLNQSGDLSYSNAIILPDTQAAIDLQGGTALSFSGGSLAGKPAVASPAVTAALAAPQVAPSASSGPRVTLMNSSSAYNPPIVAGNNPTNIPNDAEVVTQIIPVSHINAEEMVRNLSPMISSHATLIANQAANAIVVTDTQTNIKRLAEVIKAFDNPNLRASEEKLNAALAANNPNDELRVVPLHYADPIKTAKELQLLLSKDAKVTADPRTSSLILLDAKTNMNRTVDAAIAADNVAKAALDKRMQSVTNEDRSTPRPSAPPPIPQPEVLTGENPFSTFSLNVSDVSFKLAGASLEKGQMPEPASIRSEEFINAFDYRDPEPPPGAPIGFAWERAQYPFAHNRDLLRFSVKTAAQGRQPGRPLNIVLLLDNSGSMERADRVRIIREALRVLASQLQPQDKLSVVVFSRTARLVADGVPGSQAAQVADEVGGLTPQGGTNLEEAMRLAYETAMRHYLANGINRVVLLTDGAANLGNVDPESLKQKVEANRKQGIALDGFGIGWEGYNDDLLEVLTRNGDGRYGFINTPAEAATEFVGKLAGALNVAASDVKVQVEFNPRRVVSYRQIGYAKHQLTKEQFRDNTVDAAEIAAQEAGNALYTVEINPQGEGPVATVRMRYKVPGTTIYREQAWDVPYTGSAVSLEQASPAMRLAATASAFSEWLAESPFAAEVTPDQLLNYLNGVPGVYGADSRPKKLEWMIRQAKSIGGSSFGTGTRARSGSIF